MESDGYNFLSFLTPLFPFTHLRNQNFQKMKKTPGDFIISHMCTTNDNHMMYGSCDIECNGQNILSFWNIFCPLTTPKKFFLKKWNKCLEILCTKVYQKSWS